MKKLIFILFVITITSACRKRDGQFQFAGVWTIDKVEQVKYVDDIQTLDSVIKNDTLGWFAFSKTLVEGYDLAQYAINFVSFSGLTSNDDAVWEIDQHNGDRLLINHIEYTRSRIVGGEKWTNVGSAQSGAVYTRETIYVKHK